MSFISVDSTTTLILVLANIFAPIPLGLLFVLFLRSRRQLGRAFPRKLLTLDLMPSGVYNAINTKASKDTLDTDDYEDIFLARSKTIYKPKKGGGPNLTIVDPISDSTLNARYINYILKMKDGQNPDKIKFDSREEAFFSYYETIFLPSYTGAETKWVDEEKQKVKAAKKILARKMKKTTTEAAVDGSMKQVDEFITLNPMSKMEYDNLVVMIRKRLTEEATPIFPIQIDHDIVTLNDIAKWEAKPESVVVTKGQYERGKMIERKKQHADATKILILGIVATMMMIGMSIAYKFLTR